MLRWCNRQSAIANIENPKTKIRVAPNQSFTSRATWRILRRVNKRALLKKIIAQLHDELESFARAARAAHAEATDPQSKAENKYDTRGLEAAYLAGAQSRQAAETQNAIETFQKLALKEFKPGEPAELSAVVEVESHGER